MEPTEHDKRVGEIIATHIRQYEVDRWFEHDKAFRPTLEDVRASGYTVRRNDAANTVPMPRPETYESAGSYRIARERVRQILEENFTPDHDAEHDEHELAQAAECYLTAFIVSGDDEQIPLEEVETLGADWPWERSWWKPSKDPIRNLEKAGALIAAEIDRLLIEEADQARRRTSKGELI